MKQRSYFLLPILLLVSQSEKTNASETQMENNDFVTLSYRHIIYFGSFTILTVGALSLLYLYEKKQHNALKNHGKNFAADFEKLFHALVSDEEHNKFFLRSLHNSFVPNQKVDTYPNDDIENFDYSEWGDNNLYKKNPCLNNFNGLANQLLGLHTISSYIHNCFIDDREYRPSKPYSIQNDHEKINKWSKGLQGYFNVEN